MRRLLFLTTALFAATAAHAQQTVPETVVTATRVPTPIERIPAAVTVITRQDIEERGYRTLPEALQSVPGLRLVQGGGVGQQASAFVRGAASRQVLVLLDGVPVNDPSEPNGAFNFGNDLLGDIERIEVVRGPASSLYGSGAIGGVINLITRRAPEGRTAQAFGEAGLGTQRTAQGNIGIAGTTERWNYLGMAQGLSTRGSDATAPRFWSNTGERESFTGAAYTARFGFRPDAGSNVEALLRWRENQAGLDNIPRDDPNNEQTDRRIYGQIRAETTLFGVWTTGLRAAYTEDKRRNVNLPDAASRTTIDDLFRGRRESYEWGNRVALPDLGALRFVNLTFGIAHERESSDSRSGNLPFQTRTDASADSTAFNLGLQARILDRLDVTAGLRRDEAEDYEGFTSWRLGGVLALPELSSRVILSAGTAFRAPSLFQRFGTIGTSFRGNPELRPEDSFSWEAGFETDVAGFGRTDFATFGATYFDTRFRNLINFNAAFSTLENVDRATARGAELSLILRPAPWLDLRGAWTVTETEDEATGMPLPRRPRNVVSASARIAMDRLVVVPELLFTGPSPEGPFASYRDNGTSIPVMAYNKSGTVVNLTASYRVTEQVTAFAEGRNLGNSRFEPANGFVVPGRSALAGVRFVF
ncbi:TonB-dependent receptor plug domain-containing protein [Falsiroseomonas oryziterrae]|uniref:TonB-dependent receptor plug domain-containing protein n=1 Tax=Falsiroseomonas oryziterrae TaxID=2911368 RepID=UPI001F43B3CD|nr:TonB-dependent receptor [Roseomonas sp. NPKOSM-4]